MRELRISRGEEVSSKRVRDRQKKETSHLPVVHSDCQEALEILLRTADNSTQNDEELDSEDSDDEQIFTECLIAGI